MSMVKKVYIGQEQRFWVLFVLGFAMKKFKTHKSTEKSQANPIQLPPRLPCALRGKKVDGSEFLRILEGSSPSARGAMRPAPSPPPPQVSFPGGT